MIPFFEIKNLFLILLEMLLDRIESEGARGAMLSRCSKVNWVIILTSLPKSKYIINKKIKRETSPKCLHI